MVYHLSHGPAAVHTKDHEDCPVCEPARIEGLKVITAEMCFTEAARIWLANFELPFADTTTATVARYVKATTLISYRQYCESLALFFGGMPLGKIHHGNVREFQRARMTGAEPFIRRRRPHESPMSSPVRAKKVNQEFGVLRRIMLDGGAWPIEMERACKRLVEEESEQQRALEPDQQVLWLTTAASRERWNVVHWYSVLGIGCTMSTNELRYLRVGDINLFHRTIAVAGEGVKCKGRKRMIALLTADELWAAEKLLERAAECGCNSPRHYVFPFRIKKYDWVPTRPMSTSGLKREWGEVREETGLAWFRQYDLRHTGGTRLAEDGWRPAQIKARMGHLTDEMNEHYTHVGESAQRREHDRVHALKFAPRAVGVEGRNAYGRQRVVS